MGFNSIRECSELADFHRYAKDNAGFFGSLGAILRKLSPKPTDF